MKLYESLTCILFSGKVLQEVITEMMMKTANGICSCHRLLKHTLLQSSGLGTPFMLVSPGPQLDGPLSGSLLLLCSGVISKLDQAEGPAGSRFSCLVPSAPWLPYLSTGRWSPGSLHMTWASAHGLGFSQHGGHSPRQGKLASKGRKQSCLGAEASTKTQHSVPSVLFHRSVPSRAHAR